MELYRIKMLPKSMALPLSFKPHLSNQSFPWVDVVQEPAGDSFHGCWFHVAEWPHDSSNSKSKRWQSRHYWACKPSSFKFRLICLRMQLCMKDGSDRCTNSFDFRPEQEMLASWRAQTVVNLVIIQKCSKNSSISCIVLPATNLITWNWHYFIIWKMH